MAIRYYLQPNAITPDPNDQSAKVDYTGTLTENEITQSMLKRGTMVTETDITAILKLFFDVVTDELANGYIVNLPISKIRPSISGVFKNPQDVFDKKRHTVSTTNSPGELAKVKMSSVTLEKVAGYLPGPYLASFEDISSESADAVVTPGGIGRLSGEQLKYDRLQGDEGIFFIDSKGAETKVTVIASLTEGQTMFMIPQLAAGSYTLEVRRAYTASRTIRRGTLDSTLTVPQQTEN